MMDFFENTLELESETQIIPILEGDDTVTDQAVSIPEDTALPLLPLRNRVLFPGVLLPITVARPKMQRMVKKVFEGERLIGVCTQTDKNTEDPSLADIYPLGTVARITRIFNMPDNSITVILQGLSRFQIVEAVKTQPYITARVNHIGDDRNYEGGNEFVALVSSIKDAAIKILQSSTNLNDETVFAMRNINDGRMVINYICVNFPFEVEEKMRLLGIDQLKERGYQLLEILNKERQILELKQEIQDHAKEDIDRQQREYFLQQQMEAIQKELGGNSPEKDMAEFRERAKQKKWSKEVGDTFEKELKRLERMGIHSPDYSVQLNYIEAMLALPWNEFSDDNFDMKHTRQVLEHDHYGMEQVKERILEFIAVQKLKNDKKAPIICLYGPPGVGKTSLGKSVATALGRKYARISLGGLHDEAEIRGHRRTYIGAMPGRIIQNLQKVGTSNPVFVLDEIDKIATDYKGDPSSALLEVLDPEQNNTFHDNFLDIDYDLSHVMFIATANSLQTIPRPLLDRMELIEMTGYVMDEKVEIAARHLVPKELEKNGLKASQLKLPKKEMKTIIDNYTRESGVRELDRQIGTLMRKVAMKVASGEEYNVQVSADDLRSYLGTPRYTRDRYEGNDYAGVVTGLAWTQVGGEILSVESSLSKSKAPKLIMTGNLGDVMKESATLALAYIRAHADALQIPQKMFEQYQVNIHVPEGAVPKDGPSAGVTMVTSLVSAYTRRKVRRNLAMTGEITLRGKVLPVGGIKEKILAAKRAGITDIILCKENQKDIDEIPAQYLHGVRFHYVGDIQEVLAFALLKQKAAK